MPPSLPEQGNKGKIRRTLIGWGPLLLLGGVQGLLAGEIVAEVRQIRALQEENSRLRQDIAWLREQLSQQTPDFEERELRGDMWQRFGFRQLGEFGAIDQAVFEGAWLRTYEVPDNPGAVESKMVTPWTLAG